MRAVFLSAAAFSAVLAAFAAPTVNVSISKHARPVKANSYIIKLKDGVTSDSKVEYKYEQVFHGYAAELKGKDLDYYEVSKTAGEARPAVESVGQLSKRANGAGVDVYGIDTGVYTAHSSFGGRARWGATYGGYVNADGNGHGTRAAATAVGDAYGVATSADIIMPSEKAFISLPARVAAANTIGAVDSSNRKASFSNYGSVLDVWALGVNVLGAWIGSTTATNTISGTSMATPFVAGVLAVAIGDHGNKSPAELSADLESNARAVVTGAPSGTTNMLATSW